MVWYGQITNNSIADRQHFPYRSSKIPSTSSHSLLESNSSSWINFSNMVLNAAQRTSGQTRVHPRAGQLLQSYRSRPSDHTLPNYLSNGKLYFVLFQNSSSKSNKEFINMIVVCHISL